MTNSPNAQATSCTNEGRLIGPRVTWNTAFVTGPPPTMSMCTTALMRCANSGLAFSNVSVPSISGGQMKRIVRAGRASLPSLINFCSVRATSRMVTQPLALSFAPGRW